jgi:glycosyltransferase involved in cell wall biosynthesis
MKVVMVVQGLSVRGGTQKQVLRLAQDLRRRGASIQILTFDYNPEQSYQEFGQLAVETFTTPPGGNWPGRVYRKARAVWGMVSRVGKDTDILSVQDAGCEWVQLVAKLRRPRVKVVWQINDLHPAFRVGPFSKLESHWTHPFYRFLGRLVAKFARKVTVNVMKNKLLVDKCYKVESALFYPGVDQLETEPLARQFRQPLTLLSMGVFFPHRNYETLVRAIACLRDRGVDCHLILVGATRFSEAYADRIRALAAELVVSVRLTGEVNEDELAKILLDSDVFLFANLDQSWGLAVFEAMSSSLPVVVSKSAGAAELLTGRPGVCVVDARSPEEIASAVMEITKTQEVYKTFCRDAFETVSAMSWSAMYCREAWELFTELSPPRVAKVS